MIVLKLVISGLNRSSSEWNVYYRIGCPKPGRRISAFSTADHRPEQHECEVSQGCDRRPLV